MKNSTIVKFILFHIILLHYSLLCLSGVVHTSHNHDHNAHKERESDGAYSPRDHDHYDDSGNLIIYIFF